MARKYESAVLLTGDASGAVKAIDLTDDHLRQLNARQERNKKTTREQGASWETLSSSLKAGAAAMGLSVAGMAALGANQLRAVAQTDRLAKSIGVQTGQLQAMQYAAQFAGLEQDKMGDILKDVADKIGDAASNGGGEAIDVLNNLGLSAQKLVAMSPDEQLLAIADGLDQLGTRAQKVNALEALGNDASRLLPLLENNSAELRRLMQQGYDLNVAMNQSDIDSFVDAQSAIETMGSAVQGLTNSLLIDLAPAITDSVESIRDWIDEMGGMEVVVDRISTAFGVAIDVAEVLFAVWLGRKASKYLKDSKGLFTSLGAVGVGAMQLIAASTTGVNRALLVTQGRIAATAAASRGLAAAVGLLGGPAGVALLAAGAVYTYREELGLVDMSAQNATDALRENERAIKSGSQASLDNSYDALTDSLNEVSLKAQEAILQLRELEARQGFYDKSHGGVADSVSGAIDTQQAVLDDLQQRQIELQAAIEDNRQRRENLASGAAAGNTVEASSIKALIDAYDEQHTKLLELRSAREQITQAMADDPEHAEQYRRMLAEVDSQIQKLTESTKADTSAKRAAEEAQREHQKALEESAQTYSRLYAAMSPVGKAQAEYQSTLASLRAEVDEGTKSELEYYAAVAQAAVEYNNAVDAADPYTETVRRLTERYDDAYRRGQDLEQALLDVNAAYRRGDIDGQQYTRIVAGIRDEMRELALESDPAAQEMARAWEEAADRIDETFADAFAGAFDSFDDFGDQLLDGFQRLLAELAYQATLKPIVVQFTGQMQSALGIPGASGSTGSMGGLGDLAGIGSSLLNGGFGTATRSYNALMGTGSTYGGTFGSELVATGNGGFASGVNSLSSSIGTSLTSLGASYVGSYAGNEIGTALTGKQANSNIGSTVGSAAGAYIGSIVPGIGTAIGAGIGGALGGLLDSAFGSSRDYKAGFVNYAETPDRDFGAGGTPYYSSGYYADGDLGRGRESAFGSFGFTKKEKFEPDEMIDFLDAVATLDNIVASGASADQIDSVTEDLDGFYTSIKNDPLGDILEDRFDVIEQALLDSSSDVGDALINRVGDITAENADKLAPQLAQALQLGNVIDDLSGNIRDYAIGVANDTSVEIEQALADIQSSIAVNSLLATAADQLNLQFDALADGAIEAGNRIAELAGGVDPLAALSQQYYDTWMTDEQKLADLRESLTESLASVGIDTLPQTAAEVRELGSSIETMTAAGQEQLVTLYQLTPALSQYTSALGETRDAIVQQYQDITGNTPTDNVVSAWAAKVGVAGATLEDVLADIADELNLASASLSQNLINVGAVDDIDGIVSRYSAAMQAADDLASARQQQLEDERQAIESLAQISDRMALGDQSILDPLERYQEAQRQFAQAQIQAETDPTSISDFDSSRQAYLDATAAAFGQSSSQYAMAYGEVQDAISSLEDQYGESIDSLGSIESIQQQALRAQQRAEDTLLSQLQTQIDTLIGIDNLADLIDFLPEGLASQLASILPEGVDLVDQTPDSGGGSSSGEPLTFAQQSEQYLQENPDVQAAIDRGEIVNAYGHYLKYGRFEGREWPSDGSHARGLDSVPWDGYRAELHAGEMVLTRDVADTVRAGMQALEAPRSLPPAIIPPAFGSGSHAGGGQEIDELIRAVYRLSADNAQLRTQVDALIAATGAVADNTGAVIAPSERTARASEAAARNSRPRTSRSTA